MVLSYDDAFFGQTALFVLIIGAFFSVCFFTALGLVCKTIMKNKCYDNPGGWFCCGFFLGLLGVVICIVMQDKRRQNPPYVQYPNQQVNPNQPYPNQQYAQPTMQQYRQPYAQPMQAQPTANQPQGVRCQTCGMINAQGSTFCSTCGNKLT